MVVETKTNKNSVRLEASLAPAEAEVGAVAKADQKNATSILDKCYIGMTQ